MPVMLERWNDDKMDAFDAKVDGLGGQMREQRQDMRELRQDMREERKETKAGFVKVEGETKAGFAKLDKRFEKIEDRFHQMQWTLIGVAGAIIAALITAPHL
jgi:hypothetical protein